ncbi:MAG: GNAT family N-acetyltransferase [Candidatus Diapherotrites archaeon]
MEQEYPSKDIEIIELGDSTSKFIDNFECDIKELEDFLKEDALYQMKQSINRTFLWMSRKEKKLLSYITICADAISLDKTRKEQMAELRIKYRALPALKICRMGVRKEYTRKGLGTKMVAFAIRKALLINEKSACRFITLDSKNDEKIPDRIKPLRFYKKIGFDVLKTKEKTNTIHMCRDLITIIKEEETA